MIKSLPENALLGLVFVAFLAFLGIQGMDFLVSLTGTPHEEIAHHAADLSAGLTEEEYGLEVFRTAGCMGCHNIEIEVPIEDDQTEWRMLGGALGPSLNNVAERWRGNRENLTEKIVNPNASLPNSYMPSFAHLSEEDLHALVSFLLTLTADRQPAVAAEEPVDTSRFSQVQIDSGRELFMNNGCIGCHSISTTNPPIQGGALGPNLSYEALRHRTDEWQREHLRNPHAVYVLGAEPQTDVLCRIASCMLSYDQLSDEEINALVAFLQSLQ